MLGKRPCPFRRTTSMSHFGPLQKPDKESSSALSENGAEAQIKKQMPLQPCHKKKHLQAGSVLDAESPEYLQQPLGFPSNQKQSSTEGKRNDQFADKDKGRFIMNEQDAVWAVQVKLNISDNEDGIVRPLSFLEECFFCKKRLEHEQDIFIYRGDTAFCSDECRRRHIQSDERRRPSTCASPSSQTIVAA